MSDYLPEPAEQPEPPEAARRRNIVRHNAQIVASLRAAANMIEAAAVGGDLPEVMSVGVTEIEVSIQPWLPGAPVTAMRAFEALMDGDIDRKAYPLVLSGAEQVSMLHSTGTVDGQRVTVTAATHRDIPVDGFLGVTETTVAGIADAEESVDDPADDKVLGELVAEQDQRAATLEVLAELEARTPNELEAEGE